MIRVVLKLLFYTFISILVLIVTIYGTKFIAKNAKKFTNSKYIKTIDILNLSTNIKIAILEIKETIYIIAITNNTIYKIDEVSKDIFYSDESINFEEKLKEKKEKHIGSKDYVERFMDKMNKFTYKEDEENEKKC